MKEYYRVVMSGGPGGGKTTAADLFRRELENRVVVVPEAATILYSGGFPRSTKNSVKMATQRAIFHVQLNLEDAIKRSGVGNILLCDRGTIDGAAYWPEGNGDFFTYMNTTFEAELHRYDAVLFFETAAVGGSSIQSGNPTRTESQEEAIALDKKLQALWRQHPNFIFVPHNESFIKKIYLGLDHLMKISEKISEKPIAKKN